jgi:DNA-binding LytR/AlgR family response regulator
MSARAIQGQEAFAPETSVQSALPRNTAIPVGAHSSKMIAAIEMRPDGFDNPGKKAEFHAKSHGLNEVARIAIKAKGRVLFVDAIDVIAAKAEGNYVALLHKSGSYVVRETMSTAQQKLTPSGFVRIHRSTLVNASLVKDLRRDNTGTYVLRTTDGSEYSVGRAYKDNLKVIARSWLGVDLR